MSRIGNAPINIPEGVEITQAEGIVTVKGKKGELTQEMDSCVEMKIEDNTITFNRVSNAPDHRAKHGLYRALINNMIVGVNEGFKKEMEVIGVGYRAKSQGKTLNLTLGFSHPVNYEIPEGIEISTPSQTEISIAGIDKQKVGQVAAQLRAIRPPEPYKGKGVRYKGEQITLKETKKAV